MRALTFAMVIVVVGCSHSQPRVYPTREGGDRELPRNRPATTENGFAQKVVNAKEDPVTLIATDRTSCIVTPEKFRETIIGSKVWCAWR